MISLIGRSLKQTSARKTATVLVAAVVVGADLRLALQNVGYLGIRLVLPVVATSILLVLSGGDRTSLGLKLRPVQGYSYWLRITLMLGVLLAVFTVSINELAKLWGWQLNVPALPPSSFWWNFAGMCLLAPVVEGLTYRGVLCTAATVVLPPWGVVILSGVVFGALHFAYGDPRPDNQIGGFLLGWAFLRSDSILVSMFLHSLGNLCALAAQVGIWYWLHEGAAQAH